MRMPKFWKDTGPWNDAVVGLSVTLGLVFWGVLGWALGWWWLVAAAAVLGPVTGFVAGVLLISFLSSYCNIRDR